MLEKKTATAKIFQKHVQRIGRELNVIYCHVLEVMFILVKIRLYTTRYRRVIFQFLVLGVMAIELKKIK